MQSDWHKEKLEAFAEKMRKGEVDIHGNEVPKEVTQSPDEGMRTALFLFVFV